MRATSALYAVMLAVALTACGDRSTDVTAPTPSTPLSAGVLLVSDLVVVPGSSQSGAAPQAFASLPAGSIPGGVSATVRDGSGGASVQAPIVDGAVDPVAFTAPVGDTLELVGVDTAGKEHRFLGEIKKEPVAPVVTRSEPARGATDAPVMLRAHVIFSEPVDHRTVNETTFQLQLRDQPVPAAVSLSDDGLVAELQPDDSLVPGESYVLVVSQSVHDLTGLPLAAEYRADFIVKKPIGATISLASVSAARQFTCAVSVGGGVYCWGKGGQGQIGVAGMLDRHRPVLLSILPRITQVVTSDYGACGFTTTRRVLCWGSSDSLVASVPGPVFGDQEMYGAAAGGQRLCGVTLGKTVLCYGIMKSDGWTVTLVDPNTSKRLNPGEWLGDSAMATDLLPASLSLGLSHDCYLDGAGAATCEGDNQYGSLGGGIPKEPGQDFLSLRVAGDHVFSSITVGLDYTCGLAAGRAYCWGYDGQGGLGLGYFDEPTVPTPVAGGLTFSMIDAGAYHTCGVAVDGTAWCWGDNRAGQVGDGTRTVRLGPVPVAGGLRFRAVSAGMDHTCGLTTDELVYCWGGNSYGQLGDGSTSDALTPIKVARQP